MSYLTTLEADALDWAADEIEHNAAAIEAELAPVNVTLAADATKLADDVAAKLPPVVRAIVDGAIATYGAQVEPKLVTLEGEGLVALVAFLRAAAVHLTPAP